MQDFLKDRPVLAPQEIRTVAASPAPAAGDAGAPFARIVRDAASRPIPSPSAASSGAGSARPAADPATGSAAADHTSHVQPTVENGRVTKLVVTCSCGKVTEIACAY